MGNPFWGTVIITKKNPNSIRWRQELKAEGCIRCSEGREV